MAIARRTQATIRCRTCGAHNDVLQTSRWMSRPTAQHGPERSTNESVRNSNCRRRPKPVDNSSYEHARG